MGFLAIQGSDTVGYRIINTSAEFGETYVFPDTPEGERMAKAQCVQLNKMAELAKASAQLSRNLSSNSINNPSRPNNRSARMHWLFFLFIGCWLGLMMVCLIFPLFIRGLVKKSFGYW